MYALTCFVFVQQPLQLLKRQKSVTELSDNSYQKAVYLKFAAIFLPFFKALRPNKMQIMTLRRQHAFKACPLVPF